MSVRDDTGSTSAERRHDERAAPHDDAATLKELRRLRRDIRLGDTEWFDVLYRVYLFALAGSVLVVVASDAISGVVDDGVTTAQILRRGPSIAGIVVAVAFGIGLRNGADGGPVSIEAADIRHVLLAPISRTRVMIGPIAQRMRSVAFAFGLAVAVLGQLVAREVDGSRAAWAASGALFGAVVAVVYVATAVVSHAVRVPPAVAGVVAGAVVTWQSVVAWGIWNGEATGLGRIGPMDALGSVLFWGIRSRPVDWVALGIAGALAATALALGGRLRLEPLERRGQLVSQLRFAATVQDVRTVVLLRRQLRAESMRSRPWASRRRELSTSLPPARTVGRPKRRVDRLDARFVWQRGATALRRLPAARIVRIAALAAGAGATAMVSVTSSPLFAIPFVVCAFLVGLESLEPLSQEVDRPDLNESLPVDRGWLFANHLVAPAALLAVAGVIGAAAAVAVRPDGLAGAAVLGVPLAWAGAIGAVVTTVRDAPDPADVAMTTWSGAPRDAESPFALAEFAGFSNVMSGAMPIVFSAVAALPVLAMRADPSASTVLRSVLGVALCLAVTTLWVRRRDRWSRKIRAFFVQGRVESGRTGRASS